MAVFRSSYLCCGLALVLRSDSGISGGGGSNPLFGNALVISSFRLKLPTPELERALRIKEHLERKSSSKTLLLLLVLMGTSMIIGDGILTPSMSVMSAVSGLQGKVQGFDTNAVVIFSIIILVALFSIQSFGTGKVGFLFAPVLAIWFFSLGSIGIYNLIKYDISVLRAFNPIYIYLFFKRNSSKAWFALGGCVLCITGAEAMFADLGHFTVKSIQIAFTFVVFPCLLLAYFGQAAFLMQNQASVDRVFYDSVPDILFWPMLVVATLAAMIASQAMISATFSCIKQSMALGCFPRLKIIHTSVRFMGQIYIPVVNWFLMFMCIAVVATFRSTNDIANAYGGSNPLFGNALVITSTLCYAFRNVGEEFCVKKKDRVEFLAMLGCIRVLVSLYEIYLFEREELASVQWSTRIIIMFASYAATSFLFYTAAIFLLKIFLDQRSATTHKQSLIHSREFRKALWERCV